MFFVAEIFGLSQTAQSHAGTGSRRFVHLTVNENSFGFAPLEVNNAGFNHLVIQVVAFARSFADTGKDGIAAVTFGDVVNQLHNQNGLADTGTAEQTDFAAFGIRLKQVDDLNAGRQNLGFGRLVDKSGRRTMYRKLRF